MHTSKSKIAFATFALVMIAGCSTVNSKQTSNAMHEQTVGSITITYSGDDWIKISSVGTAPVHDQSPHSVSEAAKIAALHAKSNITDFMNNSVSSSSTTNTDSKSKVNTVASDNDMSVLTNVVENIRSSSSAVLRGVQVANQTATDNFVQVEVVVTKQSIAAANSVRNAMMETK
jgi:hypothetical protein